MNLKAKGYSVVTAGVIIMLCLGVAYSWGVFIKPIQDEMGWGRTTLSLAVSILLLVFSSFMPIGGLLEKRFGSAATVSLGGLLMSVAWIGTSFANSPLWLYIFYGLFGGIATGLSYIPSVSCGIKWFPLKKGFITGIIIFGFGFGAAILSPVMTELVQIFGWRTAMFYSGIIFGSIIIFCAQFLKPPTDTANISSTDHSSSENSFNYREMMHTSTFWILFITYFISMIAGMMTIGHVVAFASDRGLSAMQGALALTLLSVFNGVGRVTAGYMADHFGGKNILITLFLIISGAMFLLDAPQNVFLFYTIVSVIGLCFGGFLSVYPPLTANYFGQENFSINYGLVFIGYGSGCFLGPVLGGFVYDIMGSYHIAFYISGGLAILGAFMVYKLLKQPTRSI